MPIYQTRGTLTGWIPTGLVAVAQEYLQADDMTQYMGDDGLRTALERVQWHLAADGHAYYVEVIANRELTPAELQQLASEISGQNSDGLGEGFEQQPFAEDEGTGEDTCPNCRGTGQWNDEDCAECDGAGYLEEEEGGMISFDWKTNDSALTRVV